MSAPLRIPRLGMTTTEATLLEWRVAPGAAVQPGDVIALIETDKVESELEAPAAGTLVATGEAGQIYEVGALIGEIVT
jgi:pyruvate/2-oxoglutarate dehydrogenase complex dihydrolipoamide acyltransferase (E2) component